jgi:hypothetical protein
MFDSDPKDAHLLLHLQCAGELINKQQAAVSHQEEVNGDPRA